LDGSDGLSKQFVMGFVLRLSLFKPYLFRTYLFIRRKEDAKYIALSEVFCAKYQSAKIFPSIQNWPNFCEDKAEDKMCMLYIDLLSKSFVIKLFVLLVVDSSEDVLCL